jgi:hypothetical protein
MTDLDFQRSVQTEIVRRIREGERQAHMDQLRSDLLLQCDTLIARGWNKVVADSMRLTLEMWETAVRDE